MNFRDRAQFEAERYGTDPWIFVRELLQNARDAGATHVNIEVALRDESVRLVCRDDGDGMTEEHAKKFLFRLYASSKEGEPGMAGRFGVGFWSILRFEPSSIVIRSWPKKGKAWEVALDGQLKHAATLAPGPGAHGTEVVLTRRFMPDVEEQVRNAAHRHARYLTTRRDASLPLDVVIGTERITEALTLPAPSATFQRRGVRGVVALGGAPYVELFSKGLHVRSAASVDELLASPEDGKARQLDPMLDGLAPQVILDGEELNLVRSRSDARDDKALRRAVELSQKELARLIERQLQFSRPVRWWKRALRPALAVVAAATFVVGSGWLLSSFVRQRPGPISYPAQARAPMGTLPYQDPSQTYRGPRTEALPRAKTFSDLSYWPASRSLHLGALHLDSPEASPQLKDDDVVERYQRVSCGMECVRLSMSVEGNSGWTRLPVPSGQVLDVETLRVNGNQHDVYRTGQGEPVIYLAKSGRPQVSYRTGPGLPVIKGHKQRPEVSASVPDVSKLTIEERVEVLRDWVAQNVEYSNDPALERLQRSLRAEGSGDFIERTLRVGGGDCDVQNAVLAQLLEHAGVPARLTIGHIARNGRAEPLLHAWVEYQALEGWKVADASVRGVAPAVVAGSTSVPGSARWSDAAEREAELDPRLPEPRPRNMAAATRAPLADATGFHITVPAWRVPPTAVGLLSAAPLLALALLFFRPRVRRSTQLDQEHDVSLLLQGALARPEAFHHVPALFEQPLIPRRGGEAISLGRAYELAAAGKLYSSDVGAPFSERSVKNGAVVLDAMRPEGKVVAEALGAVNLDRWDRLLRQAQIPPLLERVNRHLQGRGERWTVMLSEALIGEPSVLNVPGTQDHKWIVVNGDALWLARAAALGARQPARALFQVIDQLALWLRLPSQRRARLLAPLARAALLEQAEGGPPAPPQKGAEPLLERLDPMDGAPGARAAGGKVRG